MEFGLPVTDIPDYVPSKFEINIFKAALVISENVRIAFLYVLSLDDGLESPIQHTKLRGNRSTGTRGEDFLNVFSLHVYGCCGHLGHVTWTIYTNLGSPFPRRLHIKFGFG